MTVGKKKKTKRQFASFFILNIMAVLFGLFFSNIGINDFFASTTASGFPSLPNKKHNPLN
jgi:nitrogen fixation protein FixH